MKCKKKENTKKFGTIGTSDISRMKRETLKDFGLKETKGKNLKFY